MLYPFLEAVPNAKFESIGKEIVSVIEPDLRW